MVIRHLALLAVIVGNLGTMPAAAEAQGQASGPSQEIRQAVLSACSGDLRRLCAGIRPGEGRIAACFRDNAARLSDSCRAALSPLIEQ